MPKKIHPMRKPGVIAVPALIFLLLIASSQSASAAGWVGIGRDAKGRTWSISRDSIQAEGAVVSVWVKLDPPREAGGSANEWMSRPPADLFQTYCSLILLEFDFSDTSYRQAAQVNYAANGRQLESNVIPSGWEYIVPGTIAGAIYSTLNRWLYGIEDRF